MSKKKDITVLERFRPLTQEELSADLTYLEKKPKRHSRIESPADVVDVSSRNFSDSSEHYEMATEVAPLPRNVVPFKRREAEETETPVREKSSFALIGLVLSVISLFYLPYVMAPLGIVLGYFGFARGDRSLGFWAMGLGVIGLIGTLIVSAFL